MNLRFPTGGRDCCNLTKVRPLFTLSQRGSDNSPLVIVFGGTL